MFSQFFNNNCIDSYEARIETKHSMLSLKFWHLKSKLGFN